jgi:hypothetical protein
MKKLASFLLIGGFIGSMALTTSCTKEYYEPFPIPEVISYSADIQPFFNAKCTNCHGNVPPSLEAPMSYGNLINGGFIDLANPSNSLLYTKINVGGSMAPYTTSEEAAMTLKWIEQGALDN